MIHSQTIEKNRTHQDEPLPEQGDDRPSDYYYDDSTGYEIYEGDDDLDEEENQQVDS